MNILVTGGLGFIGSHFIRHILNKYNYYVTNLDKVTYCANFDTVKDIENNPNYKFIKGDICNKELVEKLMSNQDIVVHFAAETHVDRSIKDASQFIETDVKGTFILLEAARKNNLKKFVHISCYDENTRALTVNGLKKFNDLKIEDIVFSINP